MATHTTGQPETGKLDMEKESIFLQGCIPLEWGIEPRKLYFRFHAHCKELIHPLQWEEIQAEIETSNLTECSMAKPVLP